MMVTALARLSVPSSNTAGVFVVTPDYGIVAAPSLVVALFIAPTCVPKGKLVAMAGGAKARADTAQARPMLRKARARDRRLGLRCVVKRSRGSLLTVLAC